VLEISLVIVIVVLILPLSVHAIERNLEVFLFVMGALAATSSHLWGTTPIWTRQLIVHMVRAPIPITAAVLICGLLVARFRTALTDMLVKIQRKVGLKLFYGGVITALGIVSSIITAIVAAIVLVEVIGTLCRNKNTQLKLAVLGCFSIGLGAALTPIGEPLSTICIATLQGEPYHAGFFFLLTHIGRYILPGIIGIGIGTAIMVPAHEEVSGEHVYTENKPDTAPDIIVRAVKVFVFIMALILLGAGFKPIIDRYIISLPSSALYWINTLSAVLDNAPLTAAEVSPQMSLIQIKCVLMGLLISGGMLIPGNIPNIICAGRLGIRSKEWARYGVPIGLTLLAVYFIILGVII
jgi:predicted cation transporter